MAEETLKQKTAKGLFWGFINNGTQQLLNLFFGIFLARLLTPADYGMVGMLTIFSLIAGSLQESGFKPVLCKKVVLLQLWPTKKKSPTMIIMLCSGFQSPLVFVCIGYCSSVPL